MVALTGAATWAPGSRAPACKIPRASRRARVRLRPRLPASGVLASALHLRGERDDTTRRATPTASLVQLRARPCALLPALHGGFQPPGCVRAGVFFSSPSLPLLMATPHLFKGAGFSLIHCLAGRYAVYLLGQSWAYVFHGSFRAARRYAAQLAAGLAASA